MPLLTKRKIFFVSADTPNLLSGDNELGACGQGKYRIWAKAAAAVDAQITVRDASTAVLSDVQIPVDTAASTYPKFERDRDLFWEVVYDGAGDTLPIEITDGTNGEIIVTVEYLS